MTDHFYLFILMFVTRKCLTHINIQWCISQTQQNFILFIIVLGQRVSILQTILRYRSYLAIFKMRFGIPYTYY